MTERYEVTWTETVYYTSNIDVDNPDKMTNDELKDYISEHMYEGISNTDSAGCENVNFGIVTTEK